MNVSHRSAFAALLLTGFALAAQAQDTKPAEADKHTTQPEAAYQAGASPLAGEPMYQSNNPKAPPMTQAEFDLGRKTYFERCAGCHGVLRKGATGKPLTPDITLAQGHRVPEGVHQLRLARRHAQLAAPPARWTPRRST